MKRSFALYEQQQPSAEDLPQEPSKPKCCKTIPQVNIFQQKGYFVEKSFEVSPLFNGFRPFAAFLVQKDCIHSTHPFYPDLKFLCDLVQTPEPKLVQDLIQTFGWTDTLLNTKLCIENSKTSLSIFGSTEHCMSPLEFAIKTCQFQNCQILWDKGARIDLTNRFENAETIFHLMAKCETASFPTDDSFFDTLFSFAKQLFDEKDARGTTPLAIALECKNWNLCKLIVKYTSDMGSIFVGDTNYTNVIQSKLSSFDMLQFLDILKSVTNLNEPLSNNVQKNTLLHYAVKYQFNNLVFAILQSKTIDLERKNRLERTAFLEACLVGNLFAMEELIFAGCNTKAIDHHQNNAFHLLLAELVPNFPRILLEKAIRLLQRQGVDINAQNIAGNTPVHFTALYDTELTVFLVEHFGLQMSPTNFDHYTFFDLVNFKMYFESLIQLYSRASTGKDISNMSVMIRKHGVKFITMPDEALFGPIESVMGEELINGEEIWNLATHVYTPRSLHQIRNSQGNTLLHVVSKKHNSLPGCRNLLLRGCNAVLDKNMNQENCLDIAIRNRSLNVAKFYIMYYSKSVNLLPQLAKYEPSFVTFFCKLKLEEWIASKRYFSKPVTEDLVVFNDVAVAETYFLQYLPIVPTMVLMRRVSKSYKHVIEKYILNNVHECVEQICKYYSQLNTR